jgi:DNA invertase Pin-like site-specific DNA recombinase
MSSPRENSSPEASATSQGRRIGYIRVNTLCADLQRQLEDMEFDRVFTDRLHRKKQLLSEFYAMMAYLREGDTLLVQRIDRLGRNPKEFLDTVRKLTRQGVRIECVTERLVFPAGEESPLRNLLLLTMAVFQEATQSWWRERQREARVSELAIDQGE